VDARLRHFLSSNRNHCISKHKKNNCSHFFIIDRMRVRVRVKKGDPVTGSGS